MASADNLKDNQNNQTGLTHLDAAGHANMVDVSDKEVTSRVAIAEGRISLSPEALDLAMKGEAKKGDVFGTARIAGIMAAKRTHELIPLCHPLPVAKVSIDIDPDPSTSSVLVSASVKVTGKTGVEMEALTAASITCLTIYDMLKAVDKTMEIGDIRLVHKSGGRSGDYNAPKSQPGS